jgi:transcriptional regulator with GAF, ATPase, and Fis domain
LAAQRFVALEPGGSGGGADVFRARRASDGRIAALKVSRTAAEGAVLAREATYAALTASRRLPELLGGGFLRREGDVVELADDPSAGPAALALAWVEGTPLREAMNAGGSRTALALRVAADVGEALAELHALGIAHGDVSVANVIVDGDGAMHLLDLGLAGPAFATATRGGTPRYLALGDADLGTARERDVLALGLVVAEVAEPGVARARDPLGAVRAGRGDGALAAIWSATASVSPHARPSAAWVSDFARAATTGFESTRMDSVEARRMRLRAAYLGARRDELATAQGASPRAAPWLAEAIERLAGARLVLGAATASPGVLEPLDRDRRAAWLTAILGPWVATDALGSLFACDEVDLAAALERLAERGPLEGAGVGDVERALAQARGSAVAPPTELVAPTTLDGVALLATALAATPAGEGAVAAVERWASAPTPLVVAATEALRRAGQLGRAAALARRLDGVPAARGLVADVLRRVGERERAREVASTALAADDDPGGRARGVLARLAFDAGHADEALALAEATASASASACEAGALAAASLGQVERALALVARGEGLTRDAEERARLSGARGYVLHGVDVERARDAYARAADHAVRAGSTLEEATYRMGEAGAAADAGDLGSAIAAARRSSVLWAHLGRPALAARAELAKAAALATAGAHVEASSAARRAIERSRECGDLRAELYATWALADAEGAPADVARTAALEGARLAATLARETGDDSPTEDEIRAAARVALHAADQLDATLAAEADHRAIGGLGVSTPARLEWLGARARSLREGSAATPAVTADRVVATLASLAEARAPLATRGPALAAAVALAESMGDGATAQRLRSALRDAAATLVARAPQELSASVRTLSWVATGAALTTAPALRPEQARELEALVRALGERERLRPLLERVVDALVLWAGVERGLLLLRAPDGRLVPRAARNLARHDLEGEQLALSQSLAHRALEAREPVVAIDAAGELPSVHHSVHALKLRSVLAVPLVARGEALGVVYLDDRARCGAFGERELAWTRTVAAVAAIAIADARDQVLLRRAARRAARASARLAQEVARRDAALDVAERELARARDGRDTRFEYAAVVGQSEPVRAMLRLVDRVTTSDVPVLLHGESGSGKELLARAIHANGPRGARPFVSENCGAIPEGLLESALFGHVRGAFTGADRARAGLFEVADGGTLFLDEVGEMSLAMQAKLLRVLEDGLVRPVGTERTRKVDVRVIAATHRDLAAMVKARAFREDLLYRLAVLTITIPPLRERPNDIPILVDHFVRKHGRGAHVRVTRAALERLVAYPWPGNVRQLENEVRRALVLTDGTIDREHLSPEIERSGAEAARELGLDVRARIDALETDLVREAMRRTGDNQTQAARLLGLSRFGLQKMIKRLGLA